MGSVSSTIGPGQQQFDVGPGTSELFDGRSGSSSPACAISRAARQPAVAFHNGVFGMFEDPRFEQGTRASSSN